MKKIFIGIILSTACINASSAQNLVPNSSFEIFVECPDTSVLSGYINLDSTWFGFNSADYMNACDATNYLGVPINRFGNQHAYMGDAYVGLISYISNGFGREYVEVELISPLITDQTYYVQFQISLADTFQYAIENIGALFTDTLFNPFPPPSYNWQTGVPQIENPSGNILNDKINWVAINGSFVAQGGEKYMTIGNFRNDAQTNFLFLGGGDPSAKGAYYYIDDVYVGTTPPVSINENEKNNFNFKLYPNPNNGNITLEYSLKENETGMFNLYNITGTLICSHPLQKNNPKLFINNDELEAGIYLYDVSINNKKIKTNKMVIIK